MAVTTINNGLTQVSGIKYTVTTDNSGDWAAVSNDVYFLDKATGIIYYKNSSGEILNGFSSVKTRANTQASAATLTPNIDSYDLEAITAQAAALTIAAPTGTAGQGQKLFIRIKDDGTARGITFNAIYRAIGVTLPTTTTINKTIYLGCIYNNDATKWDVIAVAEEA